MALNVIVEAEDTAPSPPRRYEFVDPSAGAGHASRRGRGRVLGDKFKVSVGRKISALDSDVASTSAPSTITDENRDARGKEPMNHRSSGRGSPSRNPKGSSLRSRTPLSTASLFQDEDPVATDDSYQYTGFIAGSDRSVISDLSASVKPRRVPPPRSPTRGSPARKRGKGNGSDDGNSKRTESILESVLDSICNFCGSLDTTPGQSDVHAPLTKEGRKKEAEETFLGKIITCHPACHSIDVEDFGCGGCVSL